MSGRWQAPSVTCGDDFPQRRKPLRRYILKLTIIQIRVEPALID